MLIPNKFNGYYHGRRTCFDDSGADAAAGIGDASDGGPGVGGMDGAMGGLSGDMSGDPGDVGGLDAAMGQLSADMSGGLGNSSSGIAGLIGNIALGLVSNAMGLPAGLVGLAANGIAQSQGHANFGSMVASGIGGLGSAGSASGSSSSPSAGGIGGAGGDISSAPGYTPFDISGGSTTGMTSEGGLPRYSLLRKLLAVDPNRMPGSPAPRYIEDTYTRLAAGGGISGLKPNEYKAGGRYLAGPGDGMSDNIKANIDGVQEARLADGEFVIPADVVSHIGNGSSNAGAKKLHKMMDRIRKARTGNPKQGKQIKAEKFLPA